MSMTTTTPTRRRWWQRKPKAVAVGTTTVGHLDSLTIQAHQFKPMSDWPRPESPVIEGTIPASRIRDTIEWIGTNHHYRTTITVATVPDARTALMVKELDAALLIAERHPAMTDYLLDGAVRRCLAIAKGK